MVNGLSHNRPYIGLEVSICDHAQVFGDSRVTRNARIYGNALISLNDMVFGQARVSGNIWVYGNTLVFGNTLLNIGRIIDGNYIGIVFIASEYLVSSRKNVLVINPQGGVLNLTQE